jgi:hypothetical protein
VNSGAPLLAALASHPRRHRKRSAGQSALGGRPAFRLTIGCSSFYYVSDGEETSPAEPDWKHRGALWGANAWKSNDVDQRHYQRAEQSTSEDQAGGKREDKKP